MGQSFDPKRYAVLVVEDDALVRAEAVDLCEDAGFTTYEARNAEPVARFLVAHLADGGEAWLTDPGRVHAEGFHAVAAAHGLALLGARRLPARAHDSTVTLLRFGRGEKPGSHPVPR